MPLLANPNRGAGSRCDTASLGGHRTGRTARTRRRPSRDARASGVQPAYTRASPSLFKSFVLPPRSSGSGGKAYASNISWVHLLVFLERGTTLVANSEKHFCAAPRRSVLELEKCMTKRVRHLPVYRLPALTRVMMCRAAAWLERCSSVRSEEHTSELQSRGHLVCRLLLEKK